VIELVSRAVCILILWPALVLVWGLPGRPSPAPRPAGLAIYRRQWAAVIPMRQRVLAVRLQVVLA
jgi:hypothetical protein